MAVLGIFVGPARPRDQGETLPRTRFTPSALVRRSGDPTRTILKPNIGFCRLLKSRLPFKVDRMFWGCPHLLISYLRTAVRACGSAFHTLLTHEQKPLWALEPGFRLRIRTQSQIFVKLLLIAAVETEALLGILVLRASNNIKHWNQLIRDAIRVVVRRI